MNVDAHRKHPRPNIYNSNSKTETQISYEFETWLILLTNTQKQELISRLRNSLSKQPTLSIRDNLEKQAYRQIAKNSGAAITEIDVDIGEFVAFKSGELRNSGSIVEVSQMLNDISRGFGRSVFRRDEENYNVAYATFLNNALSGSTSSEPIRKQVEAWVTVISEYMT
jgi:hypothetical protein